MNVHVLVPVQKEIGIQGKAELQADGSRLVYLHPHPSLSSPQSRKRVEAPADTGVCLPQALTSISKVRRVDFGSLARRDTKHKGGRIRPETVVRTSPVFVYGPHRVKKRVQIVYIISQKPCPPQSVNWLPTCINPDINQPTGKLSNASFKNSSFREPRLMTYKKTLSFFC